MGRKNTCLLLAGKEADGFESGEAKRFCDNRKARTLKKERGGCGYFANLGKAGEGLIMECCRRLPTAEEFNEFCECRGMCPHEAAKAALPHVDVVVAPYVYLLSPQIRTNLLASMEVSEEDTVLVLDEAHNVLESAREIESFHISSLDVELAMNEVAEHGDPLLGEGVPLSRLLGVLNGAMGPFANADEDAALPENYLEDRLAAAGLPKAEVKAAMEKVAAFGNSVIEKRLQMGDAPSSAAARIADALADWVSAGPRFVRFGGQAGRTYLKAFCMEPRKSLDIIHQCHAAVHMSGTLRPFDQYVETLGLTDPVKLHFPSPFPRSNRALFYVDDVTTSQDRHRQHEAHGSAHRERMQRREKEHYGVLSLLHDNEPAVGNGFPRGRREARLLGKEGVLAGRPAARHSVFQEGRAERKRVHGRHGRARFRGCGLPQ
jgi:DNA excision repair protein ERCC-2